MKQEDVLKFQMMSAELEQLQNFLGDLDKKMTEIAGLVQALETFSGLELNQETLFPLASGIFAKGNLTSHDLQVNVGQGVIVKRSSKDVITMIHEQLDGLRNQQAASLKQQDDLYSQLQELEKKVSSELEEK